MKPIKQINDAGFTLVEVIVTLMVASILIAIVSNFAIDSLVRTTINNTRAELINDAQTALDVATNDMRVASGAQGNNRWGDPHAPGAPGNQYSWTSNSQRVVLASPTINTDGNVIFVDASQYISQKDDEIYFVDNGTLYKRVIAAPEASNKAKTTCPEAQASSSCPKDTALMRNVESINFKYYDNQDEEVAPADARSIEMTVNMKATKYGQDVTASYKTRAVFRNV